MRNTAWNRHYIQGLPIEGNARAEVLGTVVHPFAGVGIEVRYQDYDRPIFLSESVLRDRALYVATAS